MIPSEVRIVRLEPLRVACFNGFGPSPEELAWKKMLAWAEAQQLFADGQAHRIFGYNNPDPTPGSPNYGYDFWVTLGPAVTVSGDARLINFTGGLYAVTRFVGEAGPDIPAAWKKLVAWVEQSRYRPARHQWLEEHFYPTSPEPGFCIDLYMPIAE